MSGAFRVAMRLLLGVAGPAGGHEIKVFSSRHLLPEGGGKATIYLSWGHRVPEAERVDIAAVEVDTRSECDLDAHIATFTLEVRP